LLDHYKQQQIDPSDMTRTYTQFTAGMNTKGDAKLIGSLSGGYSNGQEFMTVAEATMSTEGDYKDSRVQYYHVFKADSALTPRYAASLDVIDNDLFSSASLGAATVFKTGIQGFDIYARLGYAAGEFSDDFAASQNIGDKSASGLMWGLYPTYVADNGMFVTVYPELLSLNGETDFSNLKTTVSFGAPINENKTTWINLKFENVQNEWETNGIKESTNDNVLWTYFKLYF
ncbi:hypothetical protein AB4455_24775, partial [Vibrio sp. 10N.261.46.E12]|uniref:hypothetical protein n=3 Tax=Vibrio TaxID=662 RepID=UPI000C819A36